MRDKQEVLASAGNMKLQLIHRGTEMVRIQDHINKSEAGLVRKIHPERLTTMVDTLNKFRQDQAEESAMYATLRWVLGVTEDIDPDNLELSK